MDSSLTIFIIIFKLILLNQ